MYFWSNNDHGDKIQIKDVAGVLGKDYEPVTYYVDLITPQGRVQWEYTSKAIRDADINELKRLRDEYKSSK
jgi:hypothetical protein